MVTMVMWWVKAHDRLDFTTVAGIFAGGPAAIGAGISVGVVGTKVEAYIGSYAIIEAGCCRWLCECGCHFG